MTQQPTRHRRGQPGPRSGELLDALYRLAQACSAELWQYEPGTTGHSEYQAAREEAQRLLRSSRKYGEVSR